MAEQEVAEKPKKGGKKLLMIVVVGVIVLVLVLGGILAAVVLSGGDAKQGEQEAGQEEAKKDHKKAKKEKGHAPIFEKLETFTVNLAGEESAMLQVDIHVELANEKLREELKNYMPRVRDSVIRELRKRKPADIKSAEGTAKLMESLKVSINAAMDVEKPDEGVTSVMFSSFILQ